jgi:hypothetical protein
VKFGSLRNKFSIFNDQTRSSIQLGIRNMSSTNGVRNNSCTTSAEWSPIIKEMCIWEIPPLFEYFLFSLHYQCDNSVPANGKCVCSPWSDLTLFMFFQHVCTVLDQDLTPHHKPPILPTVLERETNTPNDQISSQNKTEHL